LCLTLALPASASRLGALGITSLFQSQIGEVVRDLDAHVEAFRTRPLDAGPHTFVAADALVLQADLRAAGGGAVSPGPMPVPGATIRARSPAKPGGIRRFRYEANGQECPDWFKIPQDLDPASAKWQMFLLGPGATIHA
jgi:hypothetical protein